MFEQICQSKQTNYFNKINMVKQQFSKKTISSKHYAVFLFQLFIVLYFVVCMISCYHFVVK